jgi:hypothetical protein
MSNKRGVDIETETSKFLSNHRSQVTSAITRVIARNSASALKRETATCFLVFQAMMEPQKNIIGRKRTMPNNRKLIKEVINYSVSLSKKLLLINSSKIGILSSRLIFLTRPHLMSPLKLHNTSSKMILHTSCQNRATSSQVLYV